MNDDDKSCRYVDEKPRFKNISQLQKKIKRLHVEVFGRDFFQRGNGAVLSTQIEIIWLLSLEIELTTLAFRIRIRLQAKSSSPNQQMLLRRRNCCRQQE